MIAAKQTVIMKFMFFSIKYRYSDILFKNINFIFSADSTFRIMRIIDFNRGEPELIFHTPVTTYKMELFVTKYYA